MNTLAKLIVACLIVTGTLSAQNDGTPTFGLQKSFGIDTIDLVTLTPEVKLPVYSKPGTQAFTPQIQLAPSCQVVPYTPNNGGSWEDGVSCATLRDWSVADYASYRYYYTPFVYRTCGADEYFYIQGDDGTTHSFGLSRVYTTSDCGATSGTFTATDNSGWQLYVNATNGLIVTAYDASGASVNVLCGGCYGTEVHTDAYGNTVSDVINGNTQSWTDEYGIASPTLTGAGSTSETLTWLDANGNNQPLTETYGSSEPTSTNFGSCILYGHQENGTVTPLTSLNFPDGTAFGLSWEQGPTSGTITGRLGAYTTRQNGTVTYTYSNNYCVVTGQGKTVRGYLYPGTLTRTDKNGTWTFSLNWACSTNVETTTVLDPGQNKTVYTFTGFFPAQVSACGGTTEASANPNLTQVQVYQNTGTVSAPVYALLETVVYCYNGNASSCATTVITPSVQITERDTYTTLGSMLTSSRVREIYDSYGNTTNLFQYDFGAGSATLTTTTTYGTWNGSTCASIGNYIQNLPCDTTVASTNTISETRNTYNSHGGLTESQQWTGSRWVVTQYTRNSNGTVATMTSPANLLTTYGYTGTGGCNGLLQTSSSATVSTGDTLTTSTEWNCYLAKPSQTTDNNGNNTTNIYNDPLLRLTATTDPAAYQQTITYNSGSTTTVASSTQATVLTTDSLDAPWLSQVLQAAGSTSYDTSATAAEFSGPNRETMSYTPGACVLGANCDSQEGYSLLDPLNRNIQRDDTGGGGTRVLTTAYTNQDAQVTLSPAPFGENAKQVQNEYDGLGRLTKSCAIGNGSTTLCGQSTGTAKGITTSMAYSYGNGTSTVASTRGAQTHSMTYDGIGRVLQSSTPEGGLWSYAYDATVGTPTCKWMASPNLSGQLSLVTDPNGDQLCYSYDTLGRIVQVNANNTACRHFYYDNSSGYSGSIPSGITTPTNSSGNLVEAATDSCASNTLITDEWFSYDKDGNITDLWELTPHSTQYYHSKATFFGNGLVDTIQLASPSVYTLTYALDGEGRWNSLTDTTTGQNLVTGPLNAMYNAGGQPIEVDLTGADKDLYTYDGTGQMHTFAFQVGSAQTLAGTLNWNANGTLNNLAIVDGFHSGGSQTCNFNSSLPGGMGYDDWGRLLGVDCGSGQWGQTFSYDQYDNLTKAVIAGRNGSIWNPGYSSSNHCNVCTYDSNGNVTSDGNNTYGWNEFSKLKWTATSGTASCGSSGECITYDAFGRMVENTAGGSYNEIWITQVGSVQMAGTTIDYGYFPGPGGGTTLINGNSSGYGYIHPDWVGSGRIVSNIPGHGVTVDQAFSPYGEIYDQFGSNNSPYDMFAGMTQNFDPGVMWDTPNREFSVVGRWLSPDPAQASWNAYAYATDPNRFIDPSGLDCVTVHGPGDIPSGQTGVDVVVGPGDCPNRDPNNEYYVDCDGCVFNSTGIPHYFADTATGNITFLDANGNAIPGTTIQGAFDPTDGSEASTTFNGAGNSIISATSAVGWTWNFTKSFVGGFRLPHFGSGSCLSVAASGFSSAASVAQSASSRVQKYAPLVIQSVNPGNASMVSGSLYTMANYVQQMGGSPQDVAAYTIAAGAVGGAASNLSAIGESALAVAKNPYVLLGTADAALLYGVVKEGMAAYHGQCTF